VSRAHFCAVDGGGDLLHPPFLVELIGRPQSKHFKKHRSSPPDPRPPGAQARVARDQLPVHERLNHSPALDAADGVDVSGRDRLFQRHDGQGPEGLRGDGLGPARGKEPAGQLFELGLGLDAHLVRPAPQLDSPVGAEQVGLELAERVAGLVFGDPEALGQGRHGDGMIGSDQQRLDLALLIQWWKSLFRFGAQVGFSG
jgi:hypothetical protein